MLSFFEIFARFPEFFTQMQHEVAFFLTSDSLEFSIFPRTNWPREQTSEEISSEIVIFKLICKQP